MTETEKSTIATNATEIFGPDLPVDDDDEQWRKDNPLFWNEIDPNNSAFAGLLAVNDECTPLERAENYKDQGNEYFKLGKHKYKEAIWCYTKATEEVIDDPVKRSVYFCNRALVNLKLGNYGKVVNDCKEAITLDNQNLKAYYRGAQAFFSLKKYDQTIKICEAGLKTQPSKLLQDLKENAKAKDALAKSQEAKREAERRKLQEEQDLLDSAIQARNIVMGEKLYKARSEYEGVVHWDEDETSLRWPVVFLYPEHSQSDFIQSFGEHETFEEHLQNMFPRDAPPLPWDLDGSYVFDRLCVYYQTNSTDFVDGTKNYKQQVWKPISMKSTLLKALQKPGHVVPNNPVFNVFVKGSDFHKKFLETN